MSDELDDVLMDIFMPVVGGVILAVGLVAVTVFRAVAGAGQTQPDPDEVCLSEEDLWW